MLVFGKPLVGTPAMLAQPLVALDLPSRVLVWEQDGTACVSYQEPEFVARRFSIPRDVPAHVEAICLRARRRRVSLRDGKSGLRRGRLGVEQRTINPWTWQDAFGFSQATEVAGGERVLYCAGQTSSGADGKPLHPGDMGAQLATALDNLETVLEQAGYGLTNVVRLNYYTTDMDAFFAHYEVLLKRLASAGIRPSSTLLGVTRLAFPEFLVEIEATAVK